MGRVLEIWLPKESYWYVVVYAAGLPPVTLPLGLVVLISSPN
jgi:hypothetical protein